MEEKINIDFTEQIRTMISPLTKKPESIMIRRMDKEDMLTDREQHYLIVCETEDLGRLIGRQGVNSSSARTLINVVARKYKKRVHLSYESFGDNLD